jgi:sugar O-acyltransferase (sialic acid O-acetyltransferase NeuD family)
VDVLVWGGTGHATVVQGLLAARDHAAVAVCDRDPSVPGLADLPLISSEESLAAWLASRSGPLAFVVAVGGERGRDRVMIDAYLRALGLQALTLCHQRAWVAPEAAIGEGSQVLAMAAVGVGARVGRQCIVNTSASVDHHCRLGDGVHVMPGATLAGEVDVGGFATIGSGATILPRVRVGEGAVVGAGAVVLHDVPPLGVVVGSPARQTGSRSLPAGSGASPWSDAPVSDDGEDTRPAPP